MGDYPQPEPAYRNRCASRRTIIAAAGVVPLLAACQVYGEPAPPVAVAPGASGGPVRPVARLDEIPVGSGAVVAGPARRPLAELPVTVENDTILLA